MIPEAGGKVYAKSLILKWLGEVSGSNAKVLESALGLPPKILHPLLAELMAEGRVKLDKVIFKVKS